MQTTDERAHDLRRMPPVSGPTSHSCSVIGRWATGLWLVTMGGMLVTVLTRPSDPPPSYFAFFFAVLSAWVASCVILAVTMAVTVIQMRRERASGFTGDTDNYVNLAQVDPVSRVVIREAGEPLLASDERRRRVVAARTWADENPEL